jgi:hypothetical protein
MQMTPMEMIGIALRAWLALYTVLGLALWAMNH